MSIKICRGCATYSDIEKLTKNYKHGTVECNIKPSHRGLICPCSECLVKTMCQEPCDRLDKYKDIFVNDDEYMSMEALPK